MDLQRLITVLRGSFNPDPATQKQAETTLSEMHKIISFTPSLLQVINSPDTAVDMATRQAAAIYLKNTIAGNWEDRADGDRFSIHEQDRHTIRENIIDCIVAAPDPLRVQLASCVQNILKHDFPGRWTDVCDRISTHLSIPTNDADKAVAMRRWSGALIVLYRLVKNYEYKKHEERGPLTDTMRVMLPYLHERMLFIMPFQEQEAVFAQKMIIKILFALIQFSFRVDLMPQELFMSWMDILRQIVERPVPDITLQTDEEDRYDLVWWRIKKWSMHLLHRIFERYGNPGSVENQYKEFAEYYILNCTGGVIETVLKVLAQHHQGVYISGRVLHEALMYLAESTNHAFTWKFMKDHVMTVIQSIVYPLMCHDEKDQELWDDDPLEYVRMQYDVFEELQNPVHAAIHLLTSCMKRKQMLAQTVQFVVQVLQAPETTPQQREGALHMIGSIAESLMKKKAYRNELENMLKHHVFPLFQSKEGFLRARACWVIREFSGVRFNNADSLREALRLSVGSLLQDAELPVQVEAGLAVHLLLCDQDRVAPMLKHDVKDVIIKVLDLIGKTHNDELCSVMQKLIEDFMDDVIPVAVEISKHLVSIFHTLLESTGDVDGKAIAALGILSTLEVILDVMDEHKEIMMQLEEIVRGLVIGVLTSSMMENFGGMDFYEEIFSLVHSLTVSHVSPAMWEVYGVMCQMFENEGVEYFMDMMPALHNYATIDSDTLLSEGAVRLQHLIMMCRLAVESDQGDDCDSHAAKLLEVIVLNHNGKIDNFIQPIVEIILKRLTSEIKMSELRTMLLQVLISCLLYNPSLFLEILQRLQPADSSIPLLSTFITQWLDDTDCFLGIHDRRVCLLGLSALVRMQPRPELLIRDPQLLRQILPACILLFDGLNRTRQAKAATEAKGDASSSDEEDGECEAEDLGDDEDEVDNDQQDYLNMLERINAASGDDDDEEGELLEETDLEMYETVMEAEGSLDEFVVFKETMQAIEQSDAAWCALLTRELSVEQQTKLRAIMAQADQRVAAANSQRIASAGGYQFPVQNVPNQFNFGT